MRRTMVLMAVVSLVVLGAAGVVALRLRPEGSARETHETSHAPAVNFSVRPIVEMPGKLASFAVRLGNWPLEQWAPPDRITAKNFERIRDGMSRDEVLAIVGPPGDYSSGPLMYSGFANYIACNGRLGDVEDFLAPSSETVSGELVEQVEWRSDNAIAFVFFRPPGQVRDKSFSEASRIAQTRLDNLLWRAQRQWHRWFP